mgnify:FL=1
MNAKHTPGPYAIEWGDGWAKITPPDGHGPIAKLTLRPTNNNVSEKEANACLFAAAPETAAERDRLKAINAELLSVAMGAQGYLRSLPASHRPDDKWFEPLSAAIAKARGEI